MTYLEKRRERKEAVRGKPLFIVLGFISAVLSLFLYPIVFGALGLVLGIIASKGRSRMAVAVIVLSIIFMGIGLIYSGVIMNYTRLYLGL